MRLYKPRSIFFGVFFFLAQIFLSEASSEASDDTKKSTMQKAPRVLVTIKPIHSLVSVVMQGVGTPELLLSGSEDPHHYQMSIKDVRRLKEADLLFWVSPNFETFLVKPIEVYKPNRVTLINTKGLQLLYQRNSSGCFYDDACMQPREFKSVESAGMFSTEWTAIDPHIWLDVENAKILVGEITAELSAFDPVNAAIYNANASAYLEKLNKLSQELEGRAKKLKGFDFVDFHNAYAYLEKRYGIQNSGGDLVTDHGTPSLKSMAKIRSAIKRDKVKCFFVEPQEPSTVQQSLAEEFHMTLHRIDPLGVDIEIGPDLYETLMRQIFDNFEECLSLHGL